MVTIQIQLPSEFIFRRELLKAVADHLTKTVDKAKSGIVRGIQGVTKTALESSGTYASLLTGDLWHILGLENPRLSVAAVVKAVCDSVQMTNRGVREVGGRLAGGLTIGIVRAGFQEILGISEASYISPEHGYQIDWLRWLLMEGSHLIVADYQYLGILSPEYSRTGLGFMVKSKKGWRIPEEFAGTDSDNWITKALETLEEPIANVLQREIQRNI